MKKALNKASVEYSRLKQELNGYLPKGYVVKIIDSAAKAYDVNPTYIKPRAIMSRYKRKNLEPDHPGFKSPMHDVEQILVKVYIQCWKMNQPLTICERIQFTNSLILRLREEKEIAEFKRLHYFYGEGDDNETVQSIYMLGRSYWIGFLRQNKKHIESSTGSPLDENRNKWTTYYNILLCMSCIMKLWLKFVLQ